MTNSAVNKATPNPANYKIVKCKNWETTNTCKYGSVCTFAHGDTELRTKSDNNLQLSENAITMDSNYMQNNMNPYLMQDPNFIYNMMLQQQMMMGGTGTGAGNDMYAMYGMQGQQGMPQNPYEMGGMQMPNPNDQGKPNDINLNDQNNMFLQYQQGQMQPPQQSQGQA